MYQSNKEVLLKEVEERGQRLEQEQQEKEDIKKVRSNVRREWVWGDGRIDVHTYIRMCIGVGGGMETDNVTQCCAVAKLVHTIYATSFSHVQTMKGFVHMEKEKFERLARQKEAQDQKLLKVMEMVAAPSPGNLARTPLGEKQATRDVSITAMLLCLHVHTWVWHT